MLERFRIPLGWPEFLKRIHKETLTDDVFNLAAQQAYYWPSGSTSVTLPATTKPMALSAA
jgi:hypothetical protein